MKRGACWAVLFLAVAGAVFQPAGYEFLQRDRVHIKDYGGGPTKTAAQNSVAYYRARAAVIATGMKQYEIVLDAGTYAFDRPLLVGTGSSFASFTLTGKGGYTEGVTGVTVLDFSEDDSQLGLVVQGARNVTIKNVVVQGANTDPDTLTSNQTDTSTMTAVEADWVTSGLSVGQHNPYAGVAIDPFSGSAPADRYDAIVDPYTGKTVCDYGASGSVRVVLDQVNCNNWVVGFAVKPADNDSNADTITARDCMSRSCAYGWSGGGSQNRAVSLYNHYFFCNMFGVTTSTHGRQIGAAPVIVGGDAVYCHSLFDFQAAQGAISISGFYAETIKSIGYFGKAAAGLQCSASVTGSQFKFRNTPSAAGTTDANDAAIHLRTFVPTHFAGTTFSLQRGVFNLAAGVNEVLFDACEWNTTDSAWSDIFYVGLTDSNGAPWITVRAGSYKTNSYSPAVTRWNCPDSESYVGTIPARFDLSLHSRKVYGPKYTMTVENSAAASGRTRISATASTYNWTGGQVSFTASNGTDFAVGDVLYWRSKADPLDFNLTWLVPCLKVSAINSNTITADVVVGVDNIDTTYNPGTVGIAYRPYAHGAAVTGTTAASTSITNVTSASSYFKVGDFISGNGIPDKTRVTAVSGTTVTISKSATASASNVYLYCDHVWRDDVPHDSADGFWAAHDASTDDAKPIMACLDYWGKCQVLGGTQYAIGTIIDQPANSLLVGWGMNNTTLKTTSGFLGPIVRPASQATIRDLKLLGRDEASSVLLQPLSTGSGVLVDRVNLTDGATGLLIDNTGQPNFTFANGRIESCTGNGVSQTAATSGTSILRSVIQSNTTAGGTIASGVGFRWVGNNTSVNGTGLILSGSLQSPLVSEGVWATNTVADISVTGNIRGGRIASNAMSGSPVGVAISNGHDCVLESNTMTPSGGATKAWQITSSAATGWRVGSNTYLAGAPDLLFSSGDELGTSTTYEPLLSGSQTVDVDSTADHGSYTTNIVVAGARLGDPVLMSESPVLASGWIKSARVSSQDTVTITLGNESGGTIDPPSTQFTVRIVK